MKNKTRIVIIGGGFAGTTTALKPGFERKLRVAIDWTLDLFFPRDTVYLRPLHTTHGANAVSHELEADEETSSVESHRLERPTKRSHRSRALSEQFDNSALASRYGMVEKLQIVS